MEKIKPELLKAIPTPASLSFDLFVTKKTMNEALLLIQRQLLTMVGEEESLTIQLAMTIIHAIFVEPETAAQAVLDILAVWTRLEDDIMGKAKTAAQSLIQFSQKGKIILWVALKKADSVQGQSSYTIAAFLRLLVG